MLDATSIAVLSFVLILQLCQVHSSSSSNINIFSRGNPVNGSCLICNVAAADIQYSEGYLHHGKNETGPVTEFLACMTESSQEPDGVSNQIYALDQLPKSFIRQYKKQLYSGTARICIHQGRVNRQKHKITVPNNPAVELLPLAIGKRRRLNPKTGRHTVLVVRVTSTVEEDPGLSDSVLQGTIFGTGSKSKPANLVSQFSTCSQGKLSLVPFTGKNVVNGILNIQYQGEILGNDITGLLQSSLNNLVMQSLGINDLTFGADHILFCLPTGSLASNDANWIAFSFVNSRYSYFQRGWCQRVSAQVHELGHQLGFLHSGMGNREYADQTCTMGYSVNVTGYPRQCFNGHKNWFSGWFDDRRLSINPIISGPLAVNLVSFVDYLQIDRVPNGVAVIKADLLYIQLNSAKKYNYQVLANSNTVTVVKSNATAVWSNILVGLSSGQSYTYSNFSGSGIGLVVEVCSISFGQVDFAKVSFYLNDGVQTSQCSSPAYDLATPEPTPPPSFASPSRRPTIRPTKLPTSSPTPVPTLRPTTLPTSHPTPESTSPPTTVPPPLTPTSIPPTSLQLSQAPTSVNASKPTPLPTLRLMPKPSRKPRVRPRVTAPPTSLLPTSFPPQPSTSHPSTIFPKTTSPTRFLKPPQAEQPTPLPPTLVPTSSPTSLATSPPTVVASPPSPNSTAQRLPTTSPTLPPTESPVHVQGPPVLPSPIPTTLKPVTPPRSRPTPKPRRRVPTGSSAPNFLDLPVSNGALSTRRDRLQ